MTMSSIPLVVLIVSCLLSAVSCQYVNITQQVGWYIYHNNPVGATLDNVPGAALFCNPTQTFPGLSTTGSALLSFGTYYYPVNSLPLTSGPYEGQYATARLGVYQVSAAGDWSLLASTNGTSDLTLTYWPYFDPLVLNSAGPLYIPSGASTAYLYPNVNYSLCLSVNAGDYYGEAFMYNWMETNVVNYGVLDYDFTQPFPSVFPADTAVGQSTYTWQLWMNVATPVLASGTTIAPYGWFLELNSATSSDSSQLANELHCNPIQQFNTLPTTGAQMSSIGITYAPFYSSPFTDGPYIGQYPSERVGVYQVSAAGVWALVAATFGSSDIPLSVGTVTTPTLTNSSGPFMTPSGMSSSITIYPNTNYSLCISNNAADYLGGQAYMFEWPEVPNLVNYAWSSYDFTDPFPNIFPGTAVVEGYSTPTWQIWMNLAVPNTVLAAQSLNTTVSPIVTSQFSYCIVTSAETYAPYVFSTGIKATTSGVLSAWQYSPGSFYITALSGTIDIVGGATHTVSLLPVYSHDNNDNEFEVFVGNSGRVYLDYSGLSLEVDNSTYLNFGDGLVKNQSTEGGGDGYYYGYGGAYYYNVGVGRYFSMTVQPYTTGGQQLQCSPLVGAAANATRFSYCLITASQSTNPTLDGSTLVLANMSGLLTANQADGWYYISDMTGSFTVSGGGTYPIAFIPAGEFNSNSNTFYIANGNQVRTDNTGLSFNTSLGLANVYTQGLAGSGTYIGYVSYEGSAPVGYYFNMLVQPYTGGAMMPCSPAFTQVAAPLCGGAGYDLSSLGAKDRPTPHPAPTTRSTRAVLSPPAHVQQQLRPSHCVSTRQRLRTPWVRTSTLASIWLSLRPSQVASSSTATTVTCVQPLCVV